MPENQPRRWAPRQTLAISPQALSALLEAKHREDDARMAEALRSAKERVVHRAAQVDQWRQLTDLYELSRALLTEARTGLGFTAGLIATVGEDHFLEVTGSTDAVIPDYRTELLEEAFIAGEVLRVDPHGEGLITIGNTDVPAGISLRAYPLWDLEEAPLGVLLLEGEPTPDRASWLDSFTELCATALAECQRYVHLEGLLVDALLALAVSREARAAHLNRVRVLSRRVARAMGLGPSETKRIGLLAMMHESDPAVLDQALREVRHGRLTGAAWKHIGTSQPAGEIFGNPREDLRDLMGQLRWLRPEGEQPAEGRVPLGIRIVRVADTFDGLIETDTKLDAGQLKDIADLLRQQGHLDPEVVSVLAHMFGSPSTY
ncbi:MAG: hypothetical protein VKP62_01605 [Candidatus Sericytochromatia bacterium]|nr:hypothetical protein [Candidatus Sericytochromatia bacterium]